ncbi:hypothetical protein P5V15_004217 [Pogonomyrmex californicus]
MLYKRFLPLMTSWLSKKNRYVVNIYYSTLTDKSLEHQKEDIDTTQMKELIEKIKLSIDQKKIKKKEEMESDKKLSQSKKTLDVINYIKKVNPDIVDVIKLMTCLPLKKTDTNRLYVIDKNTAVEYVSLIKDDLLKNTCYVAELNPGFGILTTELLKANVPLIHLYEGNLILHEMLKTFCMKYPGKLNLTSVENTNFFGMARAYYDHISTEKFQKVFENIKSKNWEDETYMQIICATDNRNLFVFIVYNLIFRKGFMLHGRPVFYIAILPSVWHKYNCTISNHRTYTYSKVMFKLMFNCKLLGSLNRKAFIPWPTRKYNTTGTSRLIKKQDYEHIYVVKLEPKADIYSQLSQKDWIIFSYFVKYYMRKRSTRVIPALEKWAPGCGIKLIAKDYTIYTEFGDLTPTKILELFKEFKTWPEYKENDFVTSMNNTLDVYHTLNFLDEE